MRKKGITILLILCIYLCAAVATLLPLFDGNYMADARVKDHKVDVEYMSIHTTGGYTGRIDIKVEVFQEGDKFYLVSTEDDCVKHELTKFEYLLCTDIDFDALRDQDGLNGSDLTYDHIEYRPAGGKTVSLPAKCYMYFPGMIYFFQRILTTPDYELTRADELAVEFAKYSYLNGSPDVIYISCRVLFGGDSSNYINLYFGNGTSEERYAFWKKCEDRAINRTGSITYNLAGGQLPEENEELMNDFTKLPSGSGSIYYRVQTNEDIVLVSMIDAENTTYYCAYADGSRQKDILRIMTGNKTGLAGTIIALAIETVVFAGVVGTVMVISKKKTAVA